MPIARVRRCILLSLLGVGLMGAGASAAPSPPTVAVGGGSVLASVPDGVGGWYIGGDFTSVGGVPRARLARLRADGTLDDSWTPNANGPVKALELGGGDVYVGGDFTFVGGIARSRIAAVNAVTGVVNPTWAPEPDGNVYALAYRSGVVYVGGFFSQISGVPRANLAAITGAGTTATATSWQAPTNNAIYSLAISGDTLFIGGGFTTIAGQSRGRAAAVSAAGTLLPWNPGASDTVSAVVPARGLVYLAGYFRTVGTQARRGLASVAADTGKPTAWDPSPDDAATSVAVSGDIAYVGGVFSAVGGQPRNYAAAVDASTGQVIPWSPDPNGPVYSLRADRGLVSVGGTFSRFDGADGAGYRLLDDFTVPRLRVAPTVTGSPMVGQTLTAADGTWLAWPMSASRRAWLRCNAAGEACAPTGATGTTLALAAGDAGSTFRISVTSSNANGETSALSAPTGAVSAPPAPTGPPPANTSPTVAIAVSPPSPLTARVSSTSILARTPKGFHQQVQVRVTPSRAATLRAELSATRHGRSTVIAEDTAFLDANGGVISLQVPSSVSPGPLRVSVYDGNTMVSSGTFRYAGPPQGYVSRYRVWKSPDRRRVLARFWFAPKPHPSLMIQSYWIPPKGAKTRLWTSRVRNGVLATGHVMYGNGPIRGRWTCVLLVGGQEVSRVSVRV